MRTSLKMVGSAVLVVAAAAFLVVQGKSFFRSGEEGSRVWFYDLGSKKLYTEQSDAIPPTKGLSGKEGNGVRAVVVSFDEKSRDAANRRIAYLTMYRPELKQLLEQVRTSRAEGKPFKGRMPEADSDFVQTNTLVRRVNETEWRALSSEEGAEITTEWRGWRGPKGQPPAVSLP